MFLVFLLDFLFTKLEKNFLIFKLKRKQNTGDLFFRNPPIPQISTFSLGQKGCAYYGKSAYFECAYYELVQYTEREL